MLAIAACDQLDNLEELYVEFGVGKHLLYLPIHEISSSLGTELCKSLPLFHAITGCDATSGFSGVGKKHFGKPGKHIQH